ncbi:MAG TPA: hypothetical protein VK162_10300, partial [Streptosporangiaceae bacterium]|nr:hypothetical protein [Streptosporangiaceae bacterium]
MRNNADGATRDSRRAADGPPPGRHRAAVHGRRRAATGPPSMAAAGPPSMITENKGCWGAPKFPRSWKMLGMTTRADQQP